MAAIWEGRLLSEWVEPLVDQIVAIVDPNSVWLKAQVLTKVALPVPFDIAFSDPLRFQRRSELPGTLERAAVREGRLVYERRAA